jgi:hypothetical protein
MVDSFLASFGDWSARFVIIHEGKQLFKLFIFHNYLLFYVGNRSLHCGFGKGLLANRLSRRAVLVILDVVGLLLDVHRLVFILLLDLG